MGKGDQKTRRGKLFKGSYGKLRPRLKAKRALEASPTPHPMEKEKPKKTPGKKA